MHTSKLRKVGGSIMLAVPPAILDLLNLGVDSVVEISVENDCLVVHPKVCPAYTLDELLAGYTDADTFNEEDKAWLDAKPVGNELL